MSWYYLNYWNTWIPEHLNARVFTGKHPPDTGFIAILCGNYANHASSLTRHNNCRQLAFEYELKDLEDVENSGNSFFGKNFEK